MPERDRPSGIPRGHTRPRVGELAATMAVASAAGAAVGLVAVALDRWWLQPPPLELGTVEGFRVLTGGLVGGLVTVAVFSLWMRTVVVGLVSDQFSPRTLTTFLEDRFQRNLLGTMSAGLVAVGVVLLAAPTDGGAPAPLAGLVLSLAAALAALAGVLAAIQHAIRSLSLPELVRRLADQALDVLDRQPAAQVELLRTPPLEDARPVRGVDTGWVVSLDVDAMLAALPPGGTLHLHTRLGEFLTPRSTLALVSTPDDEDADLEAIVGAIRLARTRSPELDLAFAVGQLVDVAVHALQGSTDTATAHEALVHLGAVLEQVVVRGVDPRHRADEHGRRVFDEAGWDAADHLQLCLERLRDPAAREPETCRHLLQMLGKVRAAAADAGDRAVVSEVGRQVDMLLALVDTHGVLPRDRRRLERVAQRVLEAGHALASTRPRADGAGRVATEEDDDEEGPAGGAPASTDDSDPTEEPAAGEAPDAGQ